MKTRYTYISIALVALASMARADWSVDFVGPDADTLEHLGFTTIEPGLGIRNDRAVNVGSDFGSSLYELPRVAADVFEAHASPDGIGAAGLVYANGDGSDGRVLLFQDEDADGLFDKVELRQYLTMTFLDSVNLDTPSADLMLLGGWGTWWRLDDGQTIAFLPGDDSWGNYYRLGIGISGGASVSYLSSLTIPEPATSLTLGIPLLALARRRRRESNTNRIRLSDCLMSVSGQHGAG